MHKKAYNSHEQTILVLMVFLQRVVNGSGRITRENAARSERLDLLVEFRGGRYPIELKLKGNSTTTSAQAQLSGYMDKLGCEEGWLVTIDRSTAPLGKQSFHGRPSMKATSPST